MPERYATVIKNNDGQEVISNIHQFEGKPSQPRGDAKRIKIGDDVQIGMVKGGQIDKAGEWGFPGVAEVKDEPKRRGRARKEQDKEELQSEPAGDEGGAD